MATRPVPFSDIKATVDTWHAVLDEGWPASSGKGQAGALGTTTAALGLNPGSRGNVARRLDTAVALGLVVREWRLVEPSWAAEQLRRYRRYDEEFQHAEASFKSPGVPATGGPGRRARTRSVPPTAPPSGQVYPPELADRIVPLLRRGPLTLDEIAERLQAASWEVSLALTTAHAKGVALVLRSNRWHLDDAPAMGHQRDGDVPRLVSDRTGLIRFAAIGDTHLGSKYARLDCLEDFYDFIAANGIKIVLHGGNWIDGEAPFNRHDLLVHGMDQQMQYLAKNYPRRAGVETWAITGEDHEGWYSRREGVDVGRYAERVMRDNGRTDWRDMGFMENYIDLVHAGTGRSSKLLLMHPGGGSAYAVSYAPQKIVEGFDGGDKPSVLLLGHYHKSSYNLIRNVHTFQVGCFEDQTVFMRKQKIAAHLGGWDEIQLQLDPETGAVIRAGGFFRNYYVRDYYRGRWSQHGPVNHAPRSAA